MIQSLQQVADQMAIAGGIPCNVDPLLYSVMKAHCGKLFSYEISLGNILTVPRVYKRIRVYTLEVPYT